MSISTIFSSENKKQMPLSPTQLSKDNKTCNVQENCLVSKETFFIANKLKGKEI